MDSANAKSPDEGLTDGFNTEDTAQLVPHKHLSGGGDVIPSGTPLAPGEFLPLQMDDEKNFGRCEPGGLRIIVISAVTFSFVITMALIVTIYYGPEQVLLHQAVASDNAVCSELGTGVLSRGGSAVDAAVAATLCMAAVLPTQCSLGGAGYMLIRDNKARSSEVFDFMGTAPSDSTEDMFDADPSQATQGGLSVTVPGLLKGLKAAHSKHGKLSWKNAVKPSADLARSGINVTQHLAAELASLGDPGQYPGLSELTSQSGDSWADEGDIVSWTRLADVLDKIASHGVDDFYTGSIADEIVQEVKSQGGILSKSDMAQYDVKTPNALKVMFLNQTVVTTPAPSGGPIVLAAMNILNNFAWSKNSVNKAVSYHHIVEALKVAYSGRGYIGDPAFDTLVTENIAENMLNATHGKVVSEMISPNTSLGNVVTVPAGGMASHLTGGISVTVFGKQEQMVTVSVTLGGILGSRLVTPSGIVLNSLMSEFTAPSASNSVNNVAAGKRPASALAPTVTYSQQKPCARRVAMGATGGMHAFSATVEVLMRVLGFQEHLDTAIEQPRFCDEGNSDGLLYEASLNSSIVNSLRTFGHSMVQVTDHLGIVNAVAKINETVDAYSDPRGGGGPHIL